MQSGDLSILRSKDRDNLCYTAADSPPRPHQGRQGFLEAVC